MRHISGVAHNLHWENDLATSSTSRRDTERKQLDVVQARLSDALKMNQANAWLKLDPKGIRKGVTQE